jgi:NAD(P)-dependent dehydrogenase (short-subunit alcohol dehydrogenase family)
MRQGQWTEGAVIVTGGGSGLGAAVARKLVQCGAPVAVLDRKRAEVGDFIEVDLADSAAAQSAVRAVTEKHGPLYAVVTSAGTDACGALADVSRESWENVVRVNLFGTAAVIREAIPHLERTRGRIVTVGSTLGLRAVSDATAYCASKFGIVGFTRALAAELAGRIGVTLLVPGGMKTAFFDDREPRYKPGPDAKLNDPDHVAEAVLFALNAARGCEIRELVVCPSEETSWP